jgi:uncharacterized protein (DUF433 family)
LEGDACFRSANHSRIAFLTNRVQYTAETQTLLEIAIDCFYHHHIQTVGELTMIPFDRITQQPEVMGGKPCIRGMRVTVGMIVGQLGSGATAEQLLTDYPYLEREDIMQAMRYAAWRTEEREVQLVSQ